MTKHEFHIQIALQTSNKKDYSYKDGKLIYFMIYLFHKNNATLLSWKKLIETYLLNCCCNK